MESKVYYYIASSPQSLCPQDPCTSLEQFAANTYKYIGSEADISLIFSPGSHVLDLELALMNVEKISMMKNLQDNGTVFVECNSQSGKFNISNTTFVSITGLHFIGCGGNLIAWVNYFTLEDSTFQGIEGRSRALLMKELNSATIKRNTFISNLNSITPVNSSTTYAGGVLVAFGSSISVTSSTFTNNSASHGGVFKVFGSSVSITSSTFSNNVATYGGVIYAFSGYSFSISKSTFTNNYAVYGGVVQTFSSPFTITDSVFTDNNANHGGVMYVYNSNNTPQSALNITSCTFTDNYANRSGVIGLYQASLNIANSTFTENVATQGGVVNAFKSFITISDSSFMTNKASLGGISNIHQSSFKVMHCMFMNNRAFHGGVMSAASNSSVSIIGSNFADNYASFGGVIEAIESSFHITDNIFTNNKAYNHGGAMRAVFQVSFTITGCTFISNTAFDGGVMESLESSFTISESSFINNSASYGGVIHTVSNILPAKASHRIINCTFDHNQAQNGGVMIVFKSFVDMITSTFNDNIASYGGVMETSDSSVSVTDSTFDSNMASYGGVMYALAGSSLSINRSEFTNNGVARSDDRNVTSSVIASSNDSTTVPSGGVIVASASVLHITHSIFINNSNLGGGVMLMLNSSFVRISDSTLSNNRAWFGGVMEIFHSLCDLTNSSFLNNNAVQHGGVSSTTASSFNITNCMFSSNSAMSAGVMFADIDLNMTISNSTFSHNTADSGGLIDISESSVHIKDGTFYHNIGSLRAFSCNLTFSGNTKFLKCMEPHYKKLLIVDASTHQGGAITVYDSTLLLTGISQFLYNQASYGGAVLASESTIIMFGETVFSNNIAVNNSGGGLYLHQSNIKVKGNCIISKNYATRGGGIHASSTTVNVYQPGTLQLSNNSATTGGAMYFEGSPRLNLLKRRDNDDRLMSFIRNHASYGGALYVVEDSAACTAAAECFIQTLTLRLAPSSNNISTVNIFFSENSADSFGSNIFGGQLDRCIPSPFAETNLNLQLHAPQDNGISYLQKISDISLNSIASSPLRICFCNSEYQPDCSHELDPIMVKKGESFPVTLVAVDQVNVPIDADVTSLLVSSKGGLSEGQQTQRVNRNCTTINFNVFSPNSSETLALFADGPCGNSSFSKKHVDIVFLNCTCSVGFEPSETTFTSCVCDCDRLLSPYITKCNYSTNSLLRQGTTSWISFINDTEPSGYLIHPNCPFDYCHPPFMNVSLNLNLPNGSDSQCAHNRRGILCGSCQQGLSLSLGSSHCLRCYSHWPAVLVTIVLTTIIGGILLVTAMLALNLTVASGLISGIIFYANITAVSGSMLSSSVPKFASVFVAWLNLEIGFDVCFFDGMDMYAKTWLQLAFPVYIISLVIAIILASKYFPKFARLIGRRDPVATLATLVLLSYAKMLSVVINALSFAVLEYPDGSQEVVWLSDGNVKYCQGKHIPLVLVAVLIALVGAPYTFLLLCWQWLVRASKWKVFKWTRNTKLSAFIATYHAPYNSKYRYWTGLLLLVRVVLYTTAAVTESASPKLPSLLTIFLVGGLVFLKGNTGVRIYLKTYADILDLAMNFNILALSVFSLYDFNDASKQTAVIYTSTIITLILLAAVVLYHVTLLVNFNFERCKHRRPAELHDYSDSSTSSQSSIKVTYSVVEAPSHHSSSPDFSLEDCEVRLLESDAGGYT